MRLTLRRPPFSETFESCRLSHGKTQTLFATTVISPYDGSLASFCAGQ